LAEELDAFAKMRNLIDTTTTTTTTRPTTAAAAATTMSWQDTT